MDKSKKAFSPVITTLIIISVSLLSIGFVWIVVKNIVQDGAENVSLNKLVLSAKIEKISLNGTSNEVKMTLKRNSGRGDVKGVKFIFSDGMNTEVIEMDAGLKELERKDFEIRLEELNVSGLEVVSVALVSESDSGEEIVGEVEFVEVNKNKSPENAETNGEGASLYELGPGDYNFSLLHEGRIRRYKVHVPESYDMNKETPLIIAFHGGGGNADSAVDYFELNSKSDEEGFIIAYPEGTGNSFGGKLFASWNPGECCGTDGVNDTGFISEMLEKLQEKFNIDENRIFLTGASNGAQMAYRVACDMPDKIAAIAPALSLLPLEECNASKPFPVMHFEGTEDNCSPYEGGEVCGVCLQKFFRSIGIRIKSYAWKCPAVLDFIEDLRKMNGCSNQTEITYSNGNAICITYKECLDNADVTLCTINGLGHSWPGKKTYEIDACRTRPNGYVCRRWKEAIGPLDSDIIANDAIWEFFKKHPLN